MFGVIGSHVHPVLLQKQDSISRGVYCWCGLKNKRMFLGQIQCFTPSGLVSYKKLLGCQNLDYIAIIPVSFLVLDRSGIFTSARAGDAVSP